MSSASPSRSIDLALSSEVLHTPSLHGRVVKGVGHHGHDEAMEAGGREFNPRPGHYIVG